MNKSMQKIINGLKKDLQAGEKLFSNALLEEPKNPAKIASAIYYLNNVAQKYIQYGLLNLYSQEMSENESKNSI